MKYKTKLEEAYEAVQEAKTGLSFMFPEQDADDMIKYKDDINGLLTRAIKALSMMKMDHENETKPGEESGRAEVIPMMTRGF